MSSENTELFTNHNEKDEDEEKDEARSTKSPEVAKRFSTQHFSSWMMLVGLLGREDNYDFDEKNINHGNYDDDACWVTWQRG